MDAKKLNLKNKLKQKIAKKQHKRTSKVVRKKQEQKITKQIKQEFNPENVTHIRHACVCLMQDVGYLAKKGTLTPIQLNEKLAKKYKFLIDTRFAIYMGIIKGELPLQVLDMMLSQVQRINTKQVSEEEASLEMGQVFAKRLDVDIDALVASAKVNKAELESKLK